MGLSIETDKAKSIVDDYSDIAKRLKALETKMELPDGQEAKKPRPPEPVPVRRIIR
jgi:hypothetical protein